MLALIADLLAGARFLGAVARQVAGDTAVIALVAVHAVTCRQLDKFSNVNEHQRLTRHMANAAAGVAGLLAETAAATATAVAGVEATAVGRALGAVASNVADFTALDGLKSAKIPYV